MLRQPAPPSVRQRTQRRRRQQQWPWAPQHALGRYVCQRSVAAAATA